MTDWIVIMRSSAPLKDEKKRQILDATMRLLVSRGFQDMVLDDVAREAGVAKGTLFLYYKSKDELFSAAFADLVDQLGHTLDEVLASGERGSLLLRKTVRAVLVNFDRNRDFISQFGAGRFPGCCDRSSHKLMQKLSDNLGRMVRILALCAKDGLIRAKNAEMAAVALFGLCRSSILHRLITGKEKSLDARIETVVDLFMHGVGGRRRCS